MVQMQKKTIAEVVDIPSKRSSFPQAKVAIIESDLEFTETVLGEGLCGDVKRAVIRSTGRPVAVKSFDRTKMTALQWSDLQQEISVQSQLDHPNVARIEGAQVTDEQVHLCIEYLPGGDVFDHLIEKQTFSEASAVPVMEQLLLAVEYWHGKNVVHRDIKPENMMYADTSKTQVKLIDFGFATHWDGESKLHRPCGTEGYRAPEVILGSYTAKADMWSVGVVAHVLLTGEMIGRRSNLKPRFSKSMKKLSMEAQDFIVRLLAVNEAKRLSASEALAHPWITKVDDSVMCRNDSNSSEVPMTGTESRRSSTSWFTPQGSQANTVSRRSTTSWFTKQEFVDFSDLCPSNSEPKKSAARGKSSGGAGKTSWWNKSATLAQVLRSAMRKMTPTKSNAARVLPEEKSYSNGVKKVSAVGISEVSTACSGLAAGGHSLRISVP